jgi:hypothetical protein
VSAPFEGKETVSNDGIDCNRNSFETQRLGNACAGRWKEKAAQNARAACASTEGTEATGGRGKCPVQARTSRFRTLAASPASW